tara:strand:- start:361 stop:1251 length:891 start_codon:yes stop_codon:yes gene_type:complete
MFGIIAPIVGAAVGIYGANKQANAAKSAQQERNNATEAQYEYNKEKWAMDKQKMLADREFKVKEIEERARQEGELAGFKDASAARQYNYQLQIRNKQQDTNERMFAKSNAIFESQLGLNALQERSARMDERQQLEEIKAEKRYEKNTAYLDGIIAEGEIRARGQMGRSVQKARSVQTLKTATALTLLDLSLQNATTASESAIRNIKQDRTVADLNAYATKMLDPGVLPMPVQPLPTPMSTFMYPRVYEDYDFGPEPVRGAMISPSSASAQVWGSSISSLAGMASQIVGTSIPQIFA